MIKKCNGCGSILQSEKIGEEGYIKDNKLETASYCERCFKIIHYGESSIIDKKVDIKSFLNEVEKEKYPIIYLLDLTCLSQNLINPLSKIKNKVYLVLTKRDLLPKSVKDKKLIEYIKKNFYNIEDIFVISSEKMWNIDNLYNRLVKDKVKKCFCIGYTNSGKSTLINSFLKSKGKKSIITTSPLPNTTTELINIKLDDLTIIDTPGFLNEKSIVNYVDLKTYKQALPKKEIKPKIYFLRPGYMLIIENFIRIENTGNEGTTLIFYLKNELKYRKLKITTSEDLKILDKAKIDTKKDEDIVIEGLGFIKIPNNSSLTIYIENKEILSKRKKMI